MYEKYWPSAVQSWRFGAGQVSPHYLLPGKDPTWEGPHPVILATSMAVKVGLELTHGFIILELSPETQQNPKDQHPRERKTLTNTPGNH